MELISDWYDIKPSGTSYKWYLSHIKDVPENWKTTHYISGVWIEIDCLGVKLDIRGVWYLLVTNRDIKSARGEAFTQSYDWQAMPRLWHAEDLTKEFTDSENFGFIAQPLVTKGLDADGLLAVAKARVGYVFSPLK